MKFLKNPALQYLGVFAVITLALFSVLATPWAQAGFVEPFTQSLVSITAFVVQPFDSRVQAAGNILQFSDGRGAVRVLSGCNAVEVCALLAAAILAFPGRLQACIIGAVVGVAALQFINLVRIITLLYLSRGSQPMFDFFHNYVWDAMIGLEGLLFFFLWARWQGKSPAPRTAVAP